MEKKELKYIPLTVKRHEIMVPVDSIMYIQVTDKLCTIYMASAEPIRLFLSIDNLEAMLPSGQFIRINRNCLVSLDYIKDIDDKNVVLFNSRELPYSRRRKTTLLLAFQERLNRQSAVLQAARWEFDLFEEFRCMDYFPFAFCIMEADSGITQDSLNFLIRYANNAFSTLVHTPLPQLINSPIISFFSGDLSNYIPLIRKAALEGTASEQFLFDVVPGKLLHAQCYQPHYGFCGLLLTPTESSLA